MSLSARGKKKQRLGVVPMALALALAAFLGGTLGLIWQSSGLDADTEEEGVITRETPTPPVSG